MKKYIILKHADVTNDLLFSNGYGTPAAMDISVHSTMDIHVSTGLCYLPIKEGCEFQEIYEGHRLYTYEELQVVIQGAIGAYLMNN